MNDATAARRPTRADYRTEPSGFGDRAKRGEWEQRIAAFDSFSRALSELLSWRAAHAGDALRAADDLWIEARLEDAVIVRRFDEFTFAELHAFTLTREPLGALEESLIARAERAPDVATLERLAAELRERYKPPVMPTSTYMRIEVALSEALMKRRSLNWFEPSLEALRAQRQATEVKADSSE